MRLIDADELFSTLAKRWGIPKDWDGRIEHTCEDAFAEIENAPTVDAAPVVHGFNTYDHDSAFECSVCGFNDWDTLTADSGKYNYCPGCGAKMDRGGENGKV